MKTLVLLLFAIVAAPLWASQAQMEDGNDMLIKCKPFFEDNPSSLTGQQTIDGAYCAGYIAGVLQAGEEWKGVEGATSKAIHSCLPVDGIKGIQAWRIVKRYLDLNPEKLHWQPNLLIRVAMIEAFPCK